MKGSNELRLNEATMIEAMQEYLDKRMGTFAPKVVSVTGESGSYNVQQFTVKTDERTAVPQDGESK